MPKRPLPHPCFRVGTDYFERYHLAAGPAAQPVSGIVDDISELLGAPAAALSPSLRAFFEQTAALVLRVESRWRPLVWPFWLLGRCFLLLIQQLVYPVHRAQVRTRVVALDPLRAGPGRGVVRTYESGGAFQIFLYSVRAGSAGPQTDVLIPLPCSHLHGRLRLDRISDSQVCWTSQRTAVDPTTGVWLVLGRWSLKLPLGESITLWDAASQLCPAAVRATDPGARFYGRHVQKLFGIALVTHTYAFRDASTGAEQ